MAANTATTGGKKNKKKSQVKLSWQEFVSSSATTAPVVTKPAYSSWAEEMEDQNVDEEPDYKSQINRAALPTAPRAARSADIDESKIPNEPPFNAFIGNLPFEVQHEDIRKFFKNLNVVDIRLQTDGMGRMKGYGHVEFETKAMLIESLSFNDLYIKNRAIKVDLASQSQDKDKREGFQQQHRKDDGDDKTLGDWRRKDDRQSTEKLNRRDDYDRDSDRFDRSGNEQQRGGGRSYNNRNNFNDRPDNDRNFDRGNRGGGYRDKERYGNNNRDRYFRDDRSDNNNRFRGSDERDNNTFERGRRDDRHSEIKDEPMDWRQAPKIDLPPPRRNGREGGSRDASREEWKRDVSGGSRGGRFGRDDDRDGGRFGRDGGRYSRDEGRSGGGRDDHDGGRFARDGPGRRQDFSNERDRNRQSQHNTDNTTANDTTDTSNTSTPPAPSGPKERPKLNLKPRSKPLNETSEVLTPTTIFGDAKPVDTAQREREIEEKLKQKMKLDSRPLDGDTKRHSQSSNQDESSSRRQLPSNETKQQKKDLKQSSNPSIYPQRGRKTTEDSDDRQSVDSNNQPTDKPPQPPQPPPVKMVPAPLPKVNAWVARKSSTQSDATPASTTAPTTNTAPTTTTSEEGGDDDNDDVEQNEETSVDEKKQPAQQQQPASQPQADCVTSNITKATNVWDSRSKEKEAKSYGRGAYGPPSDRRQQQPQNQVPPSQPQNQQQQQSRRTAVSVGNAIRGGAGGAWGRGNVGRGGGGGRRGEFESSNSVVVSVRQTQQPPPPRKEKHKPTCIDEMPKLEDHSRKDWSNKNKFSTLMDDEDDEEDDDTKKSNDDEVDDDGRNNVGGDGDDNDDDDDAAADGADDNDHETLSDFNKKSELQECA